MGLEDSVGVVRALLVVLLLRVLVEMEEVKRCPILLAETLGTRVLLKSCVRAIAREARDLRNMSD